MNYTFQSFNFRARQQARPFYDLVANIAAEEFSHVELVAATINTMLTGATGSSQKAPKPALNKLKASRNSHHFLAGGLGALAQDSMGRPWSGDYVFSSGDLVEDLTHNYFLETGARSGKLRVYETVEHPAARALTGFLLVRGGVHQVAYARALENLTGADMHKLFPAPRIPTEKIPECWPHIRQGLASQAFRFSPEDYLELAAVFNGTHPETGEQLQVIDDPIEGVPANDLPRSPRCSLPTTHPRRSRRSPRNSAPALVFPNRQQASLRTAAAHQTAAAGHDDARKGFRTEDRPHVTGRPHTIHPQSHAKEKPR